MANTETNRIENKEQLNEDFEQEVIAFLNYKEGGIIYVGVRKDGQVVGLKDVDLTQLQIKDRIKKLFNIGELQTSDLTYLSNARTISLLKKSMHQIEDTLEEIQNNSPIDIVELGLKDSWNTLGEVIGETYKDELLDELFSRFCLGK